MKTVWTTIILCSLLGATAWAQLPITHIYAFHWAVSGDSVTITSPTLWSGANLNGYNNQPAFIKDNDMVMSMSWHVDAPTDIYVLDTLGRSLMAITQTREAEYSPVYRSDQWYCVRVDTMERQHLWAYPPDGKDRGYNVLPDVHNVGYFKFIGQDSAVVFLTGEPHQLALFDLDSKKAFRFSSKIGRTFFVHDDGIYYVHKQAPETWYLKRYDLRLRRSSIITQTLTGKEDFAMHKDHMWMAEGGRIYRFKPGVSRTWEPMMDLSPYGLKNITRMIIDDEKVICVEKLD